MAGVAVPVVELDFQAESATFGRGGHFLLPDPVRPAFGPPGLGPAPTFSKKLVVHFQFA